jgi:hypothetical protein
MSKKVYTTKDGKAVRPVPKDAAVSGMDLPDSVSPPISNSTMDAVKGLIRPGAPKPPRKGWGGR